MNQSYYVYALKDPTQSPAMPFYVGKGTGVRAWDHLLVVDDTLKGTRIQTIRAAGAEVLVTVLLDDLSEAQALKVEAELIGAFGTVGNGRLLTNSILPSGVRPKGRRDVVVPSGAMDNAAVGLELLMDAMLELARANPGGVTNSDLAKCLGLQSSFGGAAKDYLTFSLIGLLMTHRLLLRASDPAHSHLKRI